MNGGVTSHITSSCKGNLKKIKILSGASFVILMSEKDERKEK